MERSEKIRNFFALARQDRVYAKMAQEYLALEDQFETIARRLSKDEENTLWAYICMAEEMNYRMLEILLETIDLQQA